MRVLLLCLLSLLAVVPALAASDEATSTSSADVQFLLKLQGAAHDLDYAGIYTYQQGATVTSSRIVHKVDGTGERERVEVLDGTPSEIIRHNQDIRRLLPDRKLVVIEDRRGDRFPSLLLGDAEQVVKYYEAIVLNDDERVAGRACRRIFLKPKDPHRYGYMLCVDAQEDLLLKVQTVTANRDVIDQVLFVSLALGEQTADDDVSESWDTTRWEVHEVPLDAINVQALGWRIPKPPGFSIMTQVSRPIRAKDHVNHLVLSDGLAAISVFIEPFNARRHAVSSQGGVHKGPVNIFRRRIGDFWLTVLGQVPADTLRDIAEHIEYVPR